MDVKRSHIPRAERCYSQSQILIPADNLLSKSNTILWVQSAQCSRTRVQQCGSSQERNFGFGIKARCGGYHPIFSKALRDSRRAADHDRNIAEYSATAILERSVPRCDYSELWTSSDSHPHQSPYKAATRCFHCPFNPERPARIHGLVHQIHCTTRPSTTESCVRVGSRESVRVFALAIQCSPQH